jgi:hypothetical protein
MENRMTADVTGQSRSKDANIANNTSVYLPRECRKRKPMNAYVIK